jgi:cytosine/adenosine deaminase-related metal-dependent hydrolase
MAADFVAFRLDEVGTAGALHDPLAALLLCHPPAVALNVVQGRVLVRGGQLTRLDLPRLVARHNALASVLLSG